MTIIPLVSSEPPRSQTASAQVNLFAVGVHLANFSKKKDAVFVVNDIVGNQTE